MKTTILTIFTALVLVTGIAKTTVAAPATTENVTVLNNVTNINKIEVRGNVELYVSDGSADEVKVYNKYYAESALIQGKNGVLRISSYKAEKLVVWVTASDLRSISAYDNAEIKSFGNLSKIEFDVDLHNNAAACLNLDAFNASLTVNDQAKACITGKADDFALKYNHADSVDQKGFTAAHTSETKTSIAAVAPVKTDDIADL